MNTEKYPAAFIEKMQAVLHEEAPAFFDSLDKTPSTSVRINPKKRAHKFEDDEKVLWCGEGKYLNKRPSFTFDPLFHAGCYYVQEASSMFLEKAWLQHVPQSQFLRVLDLCAAPGGKSTHLLSLMNGGSFLVSNEINPGRNKALQHNIIKWGFGNCIITQSEPSKFEALGEYFDVILLDAPCSGEGLFRKDKNAIEEWSEKNIANCAVRQTQIIEHAIKCLKPGGILIYSTCTYEAVENDLQIEKLICDGQFAVCHLDASADINRTKYGLQFFPHKIKGEGFYISVLKKAGELRDNQSKKSPATNNALIQQYMHPEADFVLHSKNEIQFAILAFMLNDLLLLEKHLYIKNAGTVLGQQKGKDFLPAHDLALCINLKNEIPFIELTEENAITYLRCETIKAETNEKGWHLVKHNGFNLGWAKVLDGRINNYFPKEWRILKQSNTD